MLKNVEIYKSSCFLKGSIIWFRVTRDFQLQNIFRRPPVLRYLVVFHLNDHFWLAVAFQPKQEDPEWPHISIFFFLLIEKIHNLGHNDQFKMGDEKAGFFFFFGLHPQEQHMAKDKCFFAITDMLSCGAGLPGRPALQSGKHWRWSC